MIKEAIDKREIYSAASCLEHWGIYETGGRLKSAGITPSNSGISGGVSTQRDMGEVIRDYVQSVESFETARPILLHKYGHGQPAESFQISKPGESIMRALLRLGWSGIAENTKDIPGKVLDEFERSLEKQCQTNPLYRIR